jgi:thiamine thiazole synthase
MPATSKFFQSEGREADVTRAVTRAWWQQFDQMIQSEVLIVGAGPSGLCCAWNLGRRGIRAVVVEQANHLGGGFWNGGYLANKAAIRRPAEQILEELRVPIFDAGQGINLCDPPHATAALICGCYGAGVRFLNLTVVRDVIWRENRLDGLVVNWAPLYAMPANTAHVDPIGLESHVVVDATGHDAAVVNMLAKRNICPKPPGNGAMWIEESEEEVVKRTGEYLPNLWICGLAVAAVHGTPRMGPAFGAMLLSGERAAEQIAGRLRRPATAPAPAMQGHGARPGSSAGLPAVNVNLPPPKTPQTPVAPSRSFASTPGGPPGQPPSTRALPGALPASSPTPPAGTPVAPVALPGQAAPGSRPPTPAPPPDPSIPTVNPETGRWTRGSTSRFFRKKQ